MKKFHAALKLSSIIALAGAAWMAPAIANAAVEETYVACNRDGDCWRTHKIYAYGESAPITYYHSDWYDAHRADTHIHWRDDPADDRGYYIEGRWHPDPGARAVKGGITGAGVGAAIGCVVTLPVGCAPGAAVGAAVGGGTGAVAGAASTPVR
ncbi:MAG TPA: hypothetical protein VFA87_06890 [Rhizomicrobium sp.]|nr:hypothetical protein [Rhizomicrobium sp.]